MRKTATWLIGLMTALTLTLSMSPAVAITGDFLEDTEHPYVGLVTFYDEAGAYLYRCSGSLLTSTVLLTAGHCTDPSAGAASARVYFQQDAGANFNPDTQSDPASGYPKTCADGTLGELCATSADDGLYNYGFFRGVALPDTRDVGLIILDQEIVLEEYGELAAAGTLDAIATRRGQRKLIFTASGYGASDSNPVGDTNLRERLMAQARLTNLGSHLTDGYNVQTNGNGTGLGGTCSGDSGGPLFYGGFSSDLIVGVTSFGLNPYCGGVDFAYRTDTDAVLDWIEEVAGPAQWAEIEVVRF